jgi:protein disulfide-isomerase A1
MSAKFLFAVFCLLGLYASVQASNVVDLTKDNFDEFIAGNEFVLVEFYAPWCGHCKRLAPEYETAADKLKEQGSAIKLAKVECTVEKELAERFGIQGFPTLKWFRNGQFTEFNGPREAEGIVGWVLKKSGPATHTITTKAQLDAHVEKSNAVIGFFEKDSDAHKAFVAAASDPLAESFTFIDVVSADLIEEAGEKVNTVKLYRSFAEPLALEGEVTTEAIVKLVATHGFPYFESAQASWPRLIGRGIEHIAIIVADVTDEEQWTPIHKFVTKLAQELVDKAGFVFIGKEFFSRVTQFGLSGNKFPAALVMAPKIEKTYLHDEATEITEESLRKLVEGVLDGSIKANFKTEPVPESNDGPVTVVVGSTFEDLVINNDKDVFIEFYAPWCGHCKSLMPIFEELGQHFADNDKVVIAKFDATANDNNYVKIQSYPTLFLFPAGSKDQPIAYEGGRTVEDFVHYLNEHATNLGGKPVASNEEDAHDEL